MKVALITILDNINFGTILQAYALARRIEERGCEVEFIDYWRPNSGTWQQVWGILRNKKRGPLGRLVYAVSALLLVPPIKRRLRSFLTRRFAFTRHYRSIGELRRRPPVADLYLTGSDQVWNSSYNDGVDPAFFLDFTSGRKCSYAASVGVDAFPARQEAEVLRLLQAYSEVSVRESLTCGYLRGLGVAHLSYDLDPTLLLDLEEWKLAIGYKGKRDSVPYLLVYSVEEKNNPRIFEVARAIAKQRGLRLYAVIGGDPFKLRKFGCDRIFSFASVPCFLRLMIGADFVVASSFHGTVFSLNFNKEFVSILPDRFSVRQRSLEVLFPSIAGRVKGLDPFDPAALSPLDYGEINRRLGELRASSEARLREILTDK